MTPSDSLQYRLDVQQRFRECFTTCPACEGEEDKQRSCLTCVSTGLVSLATARAWPNVEQESRW